MMVLQRDISTLGIITNATMKVHRPVDKKKFG
jgi:hypothetical protein